MGQTTNHPSGDRYASKYAISLRTICSFWLLSALMLLFLPTAGRAQYNYTTNNATITITKYTGPGGDLTVPSTIDGLPVTGIGVDAFYFNTNVTSITIQTGVTNIDGAAFGFCTNLTTITIPDSATFINSSAFLCCYKLSSIDVDAANAVYSSVDGVLYDKSQTELLLCPAGKAGSFTVPSSVTLIASGAFAFCTSLTNLIIPDSVKSGLENDAMDGCANLKAITVDALNTNYSSLDGILFNKDQTVLLQCPGGRDATYTIPNSVTSIGSGAFIYCTNLAGIIIPNTVTNIGGGAFFGCFSLTNVTIHQSVAGIGLRAFDFCWSLKTITVDGANSFYSSLDGVLFNKSQTTLIRYPLAKTGTYNIPNSVTIIDYAAFNGCIGLSNVTIPSSVNYIASLAFEYCNNLTGIYFFGNAPVIGDYPFEGIYNGVVYYPSGTAGWGATFGDLPTMLWDPQARGYAYGIHNGAIYITQYTGPGGDVTIPNLIIGLPVAGLGGIGFYSYANLTSVRIPDSVTEIGVDVFGDCPNLNQITVDERNSFYTSMDGVLFNKSLTTLIQCPGGKTGTYVVPNSVTSIENEAFDACRALTNVIIPASATNIGFFAFRGCTKLTSIMVDDLNPAYSSIDGVLFNKNQTTLIECPAGKSGSYIIPNSVTNIASDAFYGCSKLEEVIIPNSVATIEQQAFAFCYSLAAITISDGITSIGNEAFSGCSALTNVIIPSSVTNIGARAFSFTSLTNVTIPHSVNSIGGGAFSFCYNLTGVYFLGNAPAIVSSVFDGTDIFAGDTNTIAYYPAGASGWGPSFSGRPTTPWETDAVNFSYDSNNDNTITIKGYIGDGGAIVIPSAIDGLPVVSIEIEAFAVNTNLTSIMIPKSVTTIGDYAFAQCSGLAAIAVDKDNPVYSSSDGILFNKDQTILIQCPGAKSGSYTIPNTVTNIQVGAFSGSSVADILIPNSVRRIEGSAFNSCQSLTNVTIGSGVLAVEGYVFADCINLTSIIIPPSIATMGDHVFDSCLSLTNITIKNRIVGNYAFQDCTKLTSVTIPNCVTSVGQAAFAKCTGLTNVTIGTSLTNLATGAFSACTSLQEITVDELNSVYSSEDGILFNKAKTVLVRYPQARSGNYVISNTITTIGSSAFSDCVGLTSITIPNSVTTIEVGAFGACGSLTNITIPDSVTTIGNSAFAYCSNLANITIPNKVTVIHNGTFYSCSSLTNVTIPDGVTKIESFAFYSSPYLTKITIPRSVVAIEIYAFSRSGLTGIYFLGNAPQVDFFWFDGDAETIVYYLPGTTGWGPRLSYVFTKSLAFLPPAPTIAFPANQFQTSIEFQTVLGHVAGNAKITQVLYQVSNTVSGVVIKTNATGTTSWMAPVLLLPGTNVFRVKAINSIGESRETVAKYILLRTSRLTVATSGLGSVSPNLNGKSLFLGRNYTVTARPGANQLFNGWMANGVPVSTTPTYRFTMQSNLVLQANFIPNPFIPVVGTYNGLFYDTNRLSHESSGYLTLAVLANQTFAGKILLGGQNEYFEGQI